MGKTGKKKVMISVKYNNKNGVSEDKRYRKNQSFEIRQIGTV